MDIGTLSNDIKSYALFSFSSIVIFIYNCRKFFITLIISECWFVCSYRGLDTRGLSIFDAQVDLRIFIIVKKRGLC
jgi:hypothetical protein